MPVHPLFATAIHPISHSVELLSNVTDSHVRKASFSPDSNGTDSSDWHESNAFSPSTPTGWDNMAFQYAPTKTRPLQSPATSIRFSMSPKQAICTPGMAMIGNRLYENAFTPIYRKTELA
jgi:hypothetical protein